MATAMNLRITKIFKWPWNSAKKDGHLIEEEAHIIDRFLDIKGILIPEVMEDRSNVLNFRPEDTVAKALSLGMKGPYSQYPVYDPMEDKIVGMFDVEKCFLMGVQGRVKDWMSSPHFIPTVNASEFLLEILLRKDDSMYIVVDEFGAYTGVLSYFELEHFLTKNAVKIKAPKLPEGAELAKEGLILKSDIKMDDLEGLLKVRFPEGDFRTLGGMLMHYSGKIPQKGEWVVVAGWKFYIEKAKKNRIEEVLVSSKGVKL